MVSNFSHELKTPLASIRGAAELLEGGAAHDPPARARFLSNIRTDVQRLDRTVTNFLKLSRIEASPAAAPAEPIDAAAVCRETSGRCATQAEHAGVALRKEIPEEPVRIRIGKTELEQILTNLLENALQFTPTGGEILLSLGSEGTRAILRVRDNGVGIESELLPKIFDRFFTTENPRTKERGTGLGFAIVRSLVEANHGTISVTSEPDRGAEFTVRFPLA